MKGSPTKIVPATRGPMAANINRGRHLCMRPPPYTHADRGRRPAGHHPRRPKKRITHKAHARVSNHGNVGRLRGCRRKGWTRAVLERQLERSRRPKLSSVTRSVALVRTSKYAGARRAGLNHEYARERCSDQQQLQKTPTGPHDLHLLDCIAPQTAPLWSGTSPRAHPLRTRLQSQSRVAIFSASRSPRMRAMMSLLPPGANGATRWITRFG